MLGTAQLLGPAAGGDSPRRHRSPFHPGPDGGGQSGLRPGAGAPRAAPRERGAVGGRGAFGRLAHDGTGRKLLVAAEVAVSLALLVAAGLTVQSAVRLSFLVGRPRLAGLR